MPIAESGGCNSDGHVHVVAWRLSIRRTRMDRAVHDRLRSPPWPRTRRISVGTGLNRDEPSKEVRAASVRTAVIMGGDSRGCGWLGQQQCRARV